MAGEYLGLNYNQPSALTLQEMTSQAVQDTKSPDIDWQAVGESAQSMVAGARAYQRSQEEQKTPVDSSWAPSKSDVAAIASMVLSDKEQEYINSSTSAADFQNKLGHLQEDRARVQRVAASGMKGWAATLAMGVLDPAMIPLGGVFGEGAKLVSSSNVIRGALAASGAAASTEYILSKGDTQIDSEDILVSGLLGAAVGGVAGHVLRPKVDTGSLTGETSDFYKVADAVDAAPKQPSIEGLRPYGINSVQDAKTVLAQIQSGELHGLDPNKLDELMAFKRHAVKAQILDETNAMDALIRKQAAAAQLDKVQVELAELTQNPRIMDDLSVARVLQGEQETSLGKLKGLAEPEVHQRVIRDNTKAAKALRAELDAAMNLKPKGSGKALVQARAAKVAQINTLQARLDAVNTRIAEAKDALSSLRAGDRTSAIIETLKQGTIPRSLKARAAEIRNAQAQIWDTANQGRIIKEMEAYSLQKEIADIDAKMESFRNGTGFTQQGEVVTAPDGKVNPEPPVQVPPPSPDNAPLYSVAMHSRKAELMDKITQYAETPKAWWGVSVGSRLSRSKFMMVRGLNAMLNALPQGGTKGKFSAAVLFDRNYRQMIYHMADDQRAVGDFFTRRGYNLVTRMTQKAQQELAEFDNQVVLAIQGIKPTGADADLIMRAAKARATTFAKSLEARSMNGVRGFEGITPDPTYWSVIPKSDKLLERIRANGQEAVEECMAAAYAKGKRLSKIADRTVAHEIGRLIAKAHVARTLTTRLGSKVAVGKVLTAQARSFMTKELRKVGVPSEELDAWVAAMEAVEDAASMSNRAKVSFGADITHTDGELRMVDLIDTSSDVPLQYGREAAADAALARVGFKSRGDVDMMLKDTMAYGMNHIEDELKAGRITKADAIKLGDELDTQVKELNDTMKQLYGHSLDVDSEGNIPKWVRTSRVARQISSSISLSWNGLASIPEAGNIIGRQGLWTVLRQVPKMKIRPSQMRVQDPILEAWSDVVGAYGHLDGWFHGSRKGTDVLLTQGQTIGNIEKMSLSVAEMQQHLSGFKAIQHGFEEISLRSMIANLDKAAREGGASGKMYKQFAETGLNPDELDDVLSILKSNRITRKWEGQTFDIADLDKIPYELRDKLGASMTEQLHSTMQKNLIGETPVILNTEFGRLLLQFMTFPIVAVEKQLIRGIRSGPAGFVRDSLWQAGLAYSAYMSLVWARSKQAADKEQYLQAALEPKSVAYGTMQRMGGLGALDLVFNGLATFDAAPDWIQSQPASAGAQSLAKAPAALALPLNTGRAAVGAFKANIEGDDEEAMRNYRKLMRVVPVVNTAAAGFGFAAIQELRGE